MDGHDYGYIKNTLIYFYISVICYKFKHGCISLQIQFSYLLVFIPKTVTTKDFEVSHIVLNCFVES